MTAAYADHADQTDYDVIVVGAGHNGLICAAYLAKAGYRVGVFERRHVVGGAVVTEEIIPGYRFDLGGSAHSFIHLTPIIQDLQLAQYGLDYLDLDPMFFMPFPDDTSLMMWRSVEETCDSIARFSPADARQYRRLCQAWIPVALAVRDMMLTRPAPLALGHALLGGLAKQPGWRVTQFSELRYSLRQFLDRHFESEKVKALLGWMAVQSGLSPAAPGTAFIAIWDLLLHVCGVTYPRGGSGALTQALARLIEAHGGTIVTNGAVKQIIVRRHRAVGIALADGTVITGNSVVAATHVFTTARLLGDQLPDRMRTRIESLKTTNGLGIALRLAASGLPDYRACPGSGGPQHTAVQLICPSLSYLQDAWNDYARQQVSVHPLVSVMTFSALDETLSPPGKHVISLWAQYFPYQFTAGADCESAAARAAERVLDTVAQVAPNIRDILLDRLIETPAFLESEFDLIRGDIQHLMLSPGQMFMLRPGWNLSQYHTPIKALYLTGASTHPGGGIMGMSGYNTAQAVLGAFDQGS